MPRSVARYRSLHCHSCLRDWHDLVWSYSDDVPDERRNRLTCTCPTPHVQVMPSLSDSLYATCRSEQREAVYIMPDGSVVTPFSNAYDDPCAQAAIADGAYRYEFDSVRSLRRFQLEHGGRDGNELAERSRTLDWDSASIRNADYGPSDPVREGVRSQHAASSRRASAPERAYPHDYYDQVLAKHKARTGT